MNVNEQKETKETKTTGAVPRSWGSLVGCTDSRRDGRGYFLSALRAYVVTLLIGIGLFVTPSRAEEPRLVFPVSEASFRAELVGIDREWNISLKAAGKVRVIGAGELAYWGRWSDVEAGPQIVLSDGGVVRADVLLVDEKQIVVGDATGLGRGFWGGSRLPRRAAAAMRYEPPG